MTDDTLAIRLKKGLSLTVTPSQGKEDTVFTATVNGAGNNIVQIMGRRWGRDNIITRRVGSGSIQFSGSHIGKAGLLSKAKGLQKLDIYAREMRKWRTDIYSNYVPIRINRGFVGEMRTIASAVPSTIKQVGSTVKQAVPAVSQITGATGVGGIQGLMPAPFPAPPVPKMIWDMLQKK